MRGMGRAGTSDSGARLSSRSFHSISRPDARVLVLGTLPGERSLACGEYYAHPQNRFWTIMGGVLGFDALGPYEERVKQVLDHRIALWYVCAAAERPGSLDASIRTATVVPNDFSAFFAQHSEIVASASMGSRQRSCSSAWCTKVFPMILQPTHLSIENKHLFGREMLMHPSKVLH